MNLQEASAMLIESAHDSRQRPAAFETGNEEE